MLPDPLHPAVVHFPIVLMLLLPLAMAGALFAIRRGTGPRRAWLWAAGLAVALSLSAWVATQTGEAQEDRVEAVLNDNVLESHAERAERFLILSGALAALTLAGLAPGRTGRIVRVAALVGSIGVAGAGVQVGHTGGELVYRYGAATAYTSAVRTDTLGARTPARGERAGDTDD